MNDLRIPLALDTAGRVVDPAAAEKGNKYYCPSCRDLLILRKGEIKQAHFAHRATETCSQETVTHMLAKHLVVQGVTDWVAGNGNSPTIHRTCPDCGTRITQEIPAKVTGARAEQRLSSGYVADVAIQATEEIVAAVEIKVHHAVDEVKKGRIGVPFIELLGESVIEQPLEWIPITDFLRPFKCSFCEKTLRAYRKKLSEISKATRVPIGEYPYQTAYVDCWKCGKEILVFIWQSSEMHPDKVPIGTSPPRTVQYRYSRTAGTRYWVNTCPYCRSIQGDWFLYNEPDSPLFGFSSSGRSREAFQRDIIALALLRSSGY